MLALANEATSLLSPSQQLHELAKFERLAFQLGTHARVETLKTVTSRGQRWPLRCISLGSTAPEAPVLACVGGVHGLERVGSQVVLAFLRSLAAARRWDQNVLTMLSSVRVVVFPVVNPIGVARRTRCNGRGVDLMRNAPVESSLRESSLKLYRGHRISKFLPWYRGNSIEMEEESQALCDWIRRETQSSLRVVSVDVHSGFYGADRLWFPYAGQRKLFADAPHALALKQLLDNTYPRHRYVFEPQAKQYTTHGDLWDYIYDEYRGAQRNGSFLPLTLELGTSSWLKKSRRIFDKSAFFHPLTPHRTRRVLRRHVQLFEFLLRALYSWSGWAPTNESERAALHDEAQSLWSQ